METALEIIREHSGVSALLVLFAAAMLEYMLPPVPGDSIVLAGSLLVVAGAWPFWIVLAVAVAGGFAGSVVHYLLGRLGGERVHLWMRRLAGEQAHDRFAQAFQKYGLWVIASFVIMIGGLVQPSLLGVLFISAQALTVALFLALQVGALRGGQVAA